MKKMVNKVLDLETNTIDSSKLKRRRITPRISAMIAKTSSKYDIGVHVFLLDNKWKVRLHGKDRSIGSYITQDEAIQNAEKRIENSKTAFIAVHNNVGAISKIIYK